MGAENIDDQIQDFYTPIQAHLEIHIVKYVRILHEFLQINIT